jgi:hypothetical protein
MTNIRRASPFAKVPSVLGNVACASQACILGLEEGVPLHDLYVLSPDILRDIIRYDSRPVQRAGGGRVGPTRRREGWGLHESHLKRVLLATARPRRSLA